MAWNQPGEDKKRTPPRGTPDSSPLDDLLRRLQRRVQGVWRPGAGRRTAITSALIVALGLWLLGGFHQIADSERGVVQLFGRYQGTDQPGYSWHWPWPIETVRKINVTDVTAIDSKALMLMGDRSVMDVSWSVQYRVADPVRFLFSVREPHDSLRQSSETVLRELVSAQSAAALLDADVTARLAIDARGRLQAMMNRYDAGIDVAAVNFGDVRLPDAVQGAEREVNKATEERQRMLADARAYANDILPKARAQAQQRISEAEVYATATKATAQGDAERFLAQAQAYAKSPEITRNRMYIDTVEAVLAKAHKIIIDTHSGSGPGSIVYIPLDKLAAAIRAGSAPQPSAGAAGTGTGSASASLPSSTAPSAAPDADASGAPSAPGVSSGPPDDSVDRERPER